MMLNPIHSPIHGQPAAHSPHGLHSLDEHLNHLSTAEKSLLVNQIISQLHGKPLEYLASALTPQRIMRWIHFGLKPFVQLGADNLSLLHIAALHSHPVLVNQLLSIEGLEEIFSRSGQSALHTAAQHDKYRATLLIGTRYPDLVDFTDRDDATPLAVATQQNARNAMAALTLCGANRQTAGLEQLTTSADTLALLQAPYDHVLAKMLEGMQRDEVIAYLGDAERLQMITRQINDPNIKLGIDDITLLHVAAVLNDQATLQTLLEKQAIDLNPTTAMEKRTPLMLAAAEGKEGAVQWLLQAGSQLQAKDYRQQTALTLAGANHHSSVVDLLLRHGATPQIASDALVSSSTGIERTASTHGIAQGAIKQLTPVKDSASLSLKKRSRDGT